METKFKIPQIEIIEANPTKHDIKSQVNLRVALMVGEGKEVTLIETNSIFITIHYNKWVEYIKNDDGTYRIA